MSETTAETEARVWREAGELARKKAGEFQAMADRYFLVGDAGAHHVAAENCYGACEVAHALEVHAKVLAAALAFTTT